MKHLFLAVLFSIVSIATMAAGRVTVTNTSSCNVTVILFNYDASCATVTTGLPYSPVTLTPGASVMIQINAAPTPYKVGIETSFAACPTSTVATTFTSTCFPVSAAVPACGPCTATVTWTGTLNVNIN